MAARTDHTARANAIAGQTFGDLLVTAKSERRSKGGNVYYICRCSCAEVFEVRGDALASGHTKRCRRCGFQTEGHRRKSGASSILRRPHDHSEKRSQIYIWLVEEGACGSDNTEGACKIGTGRKPSELNARTAHVKFTTTLVHATWTEQRVIDIVSAVHPRGYWSKAKLTSGHTESFPAHAFEILRAESMRLLRDPSEYRAWCLANSFEDHAMSILRDSSRS